MVNLIIENVGPGETGIATGMNTVTRTVGGAFGGSATASVLASTVEATISHSSKQILETQPAEKLAFLLNITAELTQTFNLDQLLPKIAYSLFQVFKQADRSFIIFGEDGTDRLVPRVIKTRLAKAEGEARFSRRIVNKCIETAQALLSEDATSDKRFDLSQSIADCRIRSARRVRAAGKVRPCGANT